MGVVAAQVAGLASAIGTAVLGLAGSIWLAQIVRKSLRRGWIEFSGNSPSTSTRRRYHRTESAAGFWGGIVAYVLGAAPFACLAAVCALLLLSN